MKKLMSYIVVVLGMSFSHVALAAWATVEIPGMLTAETSTGSNIGSLAVTQVAMGNAQTAMGIPTLKSPGMVIEGAATNKINEARIRGSNIGSAAITQVAIGNAQTAMGNATNSINTLRVD